MSSFMECTLFKSEHSLRTMFKWELTVDCQFIKYIKEAPLCIYLQFLKNVFDFWSFSAIILLCFSHKTWKSVHILSPFSTLPLSNLLLSGSHLCLPSKLLLAKFSKFSMVPSSVALFCPHIWPLGGLGTTATSPLKHCPLWCLWNHSLPVSLMSLWSSSSISFVGSLSTIFELLTSQSQVFVFILNIQLHA